MGRGSQVFGRCSADSIGLPVIRIHGCLHGSPVITDCRLPAYACLPSHASGANIPFPCLHQVNRDYAVVCLVLTVISRFVTFALEQSACHVRVARCLVKASIFIGLAVDKIGLFWVCLSCACAFL